MNADQLLAYAETLRSYAQHSGHDLNAANLFVHKMLVQAIRGQAAAPPPMRGSDSDSAHFTPTIGPTPAPSSAAIVNAAAREVS